LSFPIELKNLGEIRIEEAKIKQLPNDEDLNPNRKFVDNRLITKLVGSEKLKKLCEKRNISWSDQQDSLSKFYKQMRESELYLNYMNNEKSSYSDDREMILSLYRQLLPEFDRFSQYFQEKSIYWDEEDFDYALFLTINLIKKTGEQKSVDTVLQLLKENKDDTEFVEVLFKKVISESKKTEDLIISKTTNWDVDRIAFIDMILMKMAVTEIMNFNQIPIKVSMNEYIDIAKSFSSPKSGQFINGIIDKVITDLKDQKKFKKIGRGLLD
jgi:N utilization substance protein B